MKIEKLEVSQHEDTRKLYEEVFSEDEKSFVDYYYQEKTKDNTIYVVREDDDIQAMLHLNPYTLMVNGNEKESYYIVAVATRKEYRGRKYMSELIRQSLQDMYQAGVTFTYLMPAAEAIYLPHDFRTVYEQNIMYYDSEEDLAEGISVQEAGEMECDEIAAWAQEKLAGNYQVYAKRDRAYYERLLKELACEDGKLMVYRKQGQIVDVRPYYEEPEQTDTSDAATEKVEEQKIKSKIMIRIVDVRRMLMSLRLKSLMAVSFQVTDSLIPENNRYITMTGTEFSGLMLMDGKPETSEGTVTISALGELVFGAKSVEEICKEEEVSMSERMASELKKIIPLSKIRLNEAV